MRVATKLGLAAWMDEQAVDTARTLNKMPYVSPQYRAAAERQIHNCRVAAYALRHLTTEQEIDFLEFQFGGPDGIGSDSYPNPITVLRPPPPEPVLSWWGRLKKALRTEPMYAYGHGTQ